MFPVVGLGSKRTIRMRKGSPGEWGTMHIMQSVFKRMFGQPRGLLGRLGGVIMAYTNDACGVWVTDLLNVASNEIVLEVGFGPGTAITRLSALAAHVEGVDASREMVAQAKARNAVALKSGRVELRHGSVEDLPFAGDTFHKAMAIKHSAASVGCSKATRAV